VLASAGDWILISDADLSTPIQELERLEARAGDARLIFGSRATGESRIGLRQSWARESMGRTFNLIVRSLGVTQIKDTQCGFKLLEGSIGRRLFEHMRVERFAFDVELVWLAQACGHQVVEVGVAWNNSPRSTVDPLRDSIRMFWDVLKLRFRRRPGRL
jgi:dolichyl-phosphate beta-glucosyltransferase